MIDQFEQWLHGRCQEDYALLAEALRECDGGRLQCLLLIRTDYWTQLTRFLKQIQMRLADGKNAAMVDLFDKQHAKKVLTLFGRALEKLPRHGDLSSDQQAFVDAAVDELAEDGLVICVNLALFAEIARRSDWVPRTLHEMGGMQGLGVLFLQESLSGEYAPPGRRRHVRAAEGCLKLLLPEAGSKVKGRLRTREELRKASGYANRPDDFAELLEILDRELRLVTASRPEDPTSGSASLEFAPDQGLLYRLTHDYLVPSVRQWLEENRRGREKHWQGRAELRLEELTDQWQIARDRRFLPGPIEFLLILLGVPWKNYQPQQRRLMRAASGWYGCLAAVGLLLLAGVFFGTGEVRRIMRDSASQVNVAQMQAESKEILRQLIDSPDLTSPADFTRILDQYRTSHRSWLLPELASAIQQQPNENEKDATRIRLGERRADAAIAMWQIGDPKRATDVLKVDADPESLTQFVHRCKERGVRAVDLWDQLLKANETTVRYGLLLALGEFDRQEIPDPQREQWVETLADWYANDPKSAIHSVSGWLLRYWGETQGVDKVDRTAPAYDPQREWFVVEVKYGEEPEADADYFTFIVFPPGNFMLGSPQHEWGRYDDEDLRQVEIEELFALCDREITNAQYYRFLASKNPDAGGEAEESAPQHPAVNLSWNDAVEYCEWLQQFGVRFRLPSEKEWNTLAEPGRSHRTVTAATVATGGGLASTLTTVPRTERSARANCVPICAVCSTCMGTSGSGARVKAQRRRGPATGCSAAAVGPTTRSTAGRRSATRTSRRAATATWASAWPQFRSVRTVKHRRPVPRSLERRPKGERAQRSGAAAPSSRSGRRSTAAARENRVGGAATVGLGRKIDGRNIAVLPDSQPSSNAIFLPSIFLRASRFALNRTAFVPTGPAAVAVSLATKDEHRTPDAGKSDRRHRGTTNCFVAVAQVGGTKAIRSPRRRL